MRVKKLRLIVSQPDRHTVLMSFFATWCKPCRDEHKYIKRFSKQKGIKIIGINYKDNNQKAIKADRSERLYLPSRNLH